MPKYYDEIVDTFYSLKNNKSPGFDELHVNVIKRNVYKYILNILMYEIKAPLMLVFWNDIHNGSFPEFWPT